MERNSRSVKPIFEKENQQKFVNKKIDLLTSLNNIKLPLQHSQSLKDNQYQSVPSLILVSHQSSISADKLNSYREAKLPIISKKLSQTEEYCNTYGQEVQDSLKKQEFKGKFLANHKIDGILRARMLDWMVEVMSSYHFQNKTYFAGVEIMDRYFSTSNQTLVPTQLHIVGVQSMFIASKMQEVYPLKMKTVFDKIAHKKISVVQLAQMQNKIAQQLDFCLVSSSIYDLAITKIVRHLTQSETYSQTLIKQIDDVCGMVGKFIYYNYDLLSLYHKQTLASALAHYILQIYKLEGQLKLSNEQKSCKQHIIQTVTTFNKKYKGLNNIFKFADKKVLEIIQGLL